MVNVNDLTINGLLAISPITVVGSTGQSYSRRIIAEDDNGTTLSFDSNSGFQMAVINPSGINEVVAAGRWTIAQNGRSSGLDEDILWFAGVDPYSYSSGSPSNVPLPNAALAVENWNAYSAGEETGPVQDYESDVAEQFREDIEDVPPPTESDAQRQKRLEEERRARQQEDYERRQREAEERAEQERQEQEDLQSQTTDWEIVDFVLIDVDAPEEITGGFSFDNVFMFENGDFVSQFQVSLVSRQRYQPSERALSTEYGIYLGNSENPFQKLSNQNFDYDTVNTKYQQIITEVQEKATEFNNREGSTQTEVTYEWRFKEMPITIQEAFLENYDILKDRSWSGGERPDTVIFQNGGRVVKLVDKDASTELSAYFRYRVNAGVRIEVIFETEALTRFLAIDDSKPDGVTREARQFRFTQYGGDKLEVDIDNEYDDSRPFLIQVKGKDWYSAEEFDDEVYISFSKVEVMEWKSYTKSTVLDYQGNVISEEVEEDEFWQRYDTAPQEALDAIPADEEFNAARKEDSPIGAGAPIVEAETDLDDFVTDTGRDAAETLDNIGESISNNWRTWLIVGGVVVIGTLALLVYVNARARK
tara:strand:- start:2032 stop:3801 length:1770 start_codon:yes stop_codon:yes gene_type:complete